MYCSMRRALPFLCLLGLLALPSAAGADTLAANGMRLVKVGEADGAIYAAVPPGDPSRLFVVQQGSGTTADIRVFHDGVEQTDPFLHLTGVAHRDGEQGLLSMAFAPDYATSGRFFVYYDDENACVSNACNLNVDEYQRADADHAGA